MAKTKKDAVKTTRPSLKSKVAKRKSMKRSAAITPKLKKLSIKKDVIGKMLRYSVPDQSSGSEDETESTVNLDIKSPRHLIKAVESPINLDQVKSGVKALFEYIQKSNENKTELFDDDQPIFLQLTSMKVPNTPNRQIRLALKHSLLSDSSDVCLIVKDVGKARDHEGTVEHYEEYLTEKGVTNIKTIIPYHQFKTEYGNQYELVRKLLGLHDYFLVDGSISGYVTHRLGKIFLEKRKMPTPVKMNATNLKEHFETCLRKTIMKLHAKSDSFIVQVGHTKMSENDVFENVSGMIDELGCEFPGGLDNIRSLGVKTDKSISVPIYLTLKNKSTIKVPVIVAKRPKQFKNVTGELTTFLDKDVTVLPTGEIIVTKQGLADDGFISESDDEQQLGSDVEEVEEGENDEEGNLSGGDDEEVDNEPVEETERKITEQMREKTAEDEEDAGILDEAEEMYLNQYQQEQTNTRRTKRAKKAMPENEEIPVKKGKRPVKEQEENINTKTRSNKGAQKKGQGANTQKNVAKAKKQGRSKEVNKDDGNVLAQAEELYLDEYEQEQTVAKKTRATRAKKIKPEIEVPLTKTKESKKKENVKDVPAKENLKITKMTKTSKKAKKEDTPNILEPENIQGKPKKQKGSTKTNESGGGLVQDKNVQEIDVKKSRKTKAKIVEEVIPAKKTKTVNKIPENEKPAKRGQGRSKTVLTKEVLDDKRENLKKSKKAPLSPSNQQVVEKKSKKVNKTTKPNEIKTRKASAQVTTKPDTAIPEVSKTAVGKKSKKADQKKNDVESKKGKEKIKSPTLKVKKGKRRSSTKKASKV